MAIEELNKALHSLAGKSRLFPDDIKFLAQCLHNKWYSVQVVAAKVLAKFHPPEALPLLKEWLMRHRNHHHLITIAQTALLSCITVADLPWIFDLYLKDSSDHRSFLMGALLQFPNQIITRQLIQDCQKEQNWNSMSILAALLTTERDAVLQSLLKNPHITNKDYLQQMFNREPLSRDQIVMFQIFSKPV